MTLSPDQVRARKGHGRLAMLTAYDYPTALALDGAGLDLILVGDSLGEVELGGDGTSWVTLEMMCHHVRAVRNGVRDTHVVGDMPAGSYDTPEQAVESARRLIEAGADSVKLEGALIPQVRAILAAGIPVMGHVGLLPQTAEKRRRYGVTPEEYRAVCDDAVALDRAGCFAVVIEAVVPDLAAEITGAVSVPTIGIAAGAGCDGQVLVTTDLVGGLPSRPAFVTPKANVFATIQGAAAAFAAEARAATTRAA